MAKRHNPSAPATARDVERVVATMAELSFDLERSVRAAIPIALSEALGADIDSARLERVAQGIFADIAARYRVNGGATLLTLRCRSSAQGAAGAAEPPRRVHW